jgi:putative transposase
MDETSTQNVDRRVPEETLGEWMDEADDVEFLRRLGFLKNLCQGDTVAEAIRREGKSTSTGYRWKDRWEDGGLEALRSDTGGGRPPKLSEEQLEAFRETVRECQPCTIDQLEALLAREFEIHFSRAYLREYLPEHGFTYTKPALQEALDDNSLSEIEWDTNQHPNTTARHPYNDQDGRMIARWRVAEES